MGYGYARGTLRYRHKVNIFTVAESISFVVETEYSFILNKKIRQNSSKRSLIISFEVVQKDELSRIQLDSTRRTNKLGVFVHLARGVVVDAGPAEGVTTERGCQLRPDTACICSCCSIWPALAKLTVEWG